jgi:O-antigen/teichoic acid export membrane protein
LSIFLVSQKHSIIPGWSAPSTKILLQLLSAGGWLFLSIVAAAIYMKVDQLMLRHYVGFDAVAQYSLAVRLSETWLFIGSSIILGYFPLLLKVREKSEIDYINELRKICALLFLIASGISILIWSLGWALVPLVFGDKFVDSVPILNIHCVSIVFLYMRTLLGKWLLAEEGLLWMSLASNCLGAFCNVLLNSFWIPEYGSIGAAWATLVTIFISTILLFGVFPRSRKVVYVILETPFFLFRSFNRLIH